MVQEPLHRVPYAVFQERRPGRHDGPRRHVQIFDQALARGTVARFNFFTPNGCDASYQTCTTNGKRVNPVTEVDNFLKREIPKVQKSPACTGSANNCLIVITFDEAGATRGTHTVLAVLGPTVRPGTYGDPHGDPSNPYTHYSTLATIQLALGLPCLAGSRGAYADEAGVTHTVTPLPIFSTAPAGAHAAAALRSARGSRSWAATTPR